MNNRQINESEMQEAVLHLLNTTPAAVAHPVIRGKLPVLTGLVAEVRRHLYDQSRPVQPMIVSRIDAMETATTTALAVSRLVCAYALRHRRTELHSTVAMSATDFARERLIMRMAPARRILLAAREHLDGLAEEGVTPAMLDRFEAEIAAAQTAVDLSRQAHTNRRTATTLLADAVRAVTEFLHYQIDPHVLLLRQAEPDFYTRYQVAREVRRSPGRRSRSRLAQKTATADPAALPATAHPIAPAQLAGGQKQAA